MITIAVVCDVAATASGPLRGRQSGENGAAVVAPGEPEPAQQVAAANHDKASAELVLLEREIAALVPGFVSRGSKVSPHERAEDMRHALVERVRQELREFLPTAPALQPYRELLARANLVVLEELALLVAQMEKAAADFDPEWGLNLARQGMEVVAQLVRTIDGEIHQFSFAHFAGDAAAHFRDDVAHQRGRALADVARRTLVESGRAMDQASVREYARVYARIFILTRARRTMIEDEGRRLDAPSVREIDDALAALETELELYGEALLRAAGSLSPRSAEVLLVESWADTIAAQPDPEVVTDAAGRSRMEATGLPWKVRDRGTGIVMLLVPPGEYTRGASPGDPDAYPEEKPAHRIRIAEAFYLGQFPVTQAEWQRIAGSNPSSRKEESAPVTNVSFNAIVPLLDAKGLRLPRESEWEYACRAGTTGSRYGSLEAIAWYGGNSGGRTQPVGRKQANPWGFFDMLGNVWEWCSTSYDPAFYERLASRAQPQDSKLDDEPQGASRVLRGGSWGNNPQYVRSSNRDRYGPARSFDFYGLRVSRTP